MDKRDRDVREWSDGWERVEGKEWMRERSEWKEMTGPLLTVHSPGLIIPFLAGLWVSLRAKGMCVGWRDEPVLIFPFIHRLRNPHTSYSFLTLLFLSFGAWISWVSCHLSRLYLGYWRWHREETQPIFPILSLLVFARVIDGKERWHYHSLYPVYSRTKGARDRDKREWAIPFTSLTVPCLSFHSLG